MSSLTSKGNIRVLIDRVQLVSWATGGRKPPPSLRGFAVIRDSFVRCQTTTPTYARCREYQSQTDGSKVYWQYERRKGWLKHWKITIVADDQTGLSHNLIEQVLWHCRSYHFLTIEVAIDFRLSAGINERFICQHATFGKSRRRQA